MLNSFFLQPSCGDAYNEINTCAGSATPNEWPYYGDIGTFFKNVLS